MDSPPQSCCAYNSYDHYCTEYHDEGCQSILYEMLSRGLAITASLALIIGFIQVSYFTYGKKNFGRIKLEFLIFFFAKMGAIICACILAYRVRINKTRRDVNKRAEIRNPFVYKTDDLEKKSYEQREADVNNL